MMSNQNVLDVDFVRGLLPALGQDDALQSTEPLSEKNRSAKFVCGDMELHYILDEKTGAAGFRMLPISATGRAVTARKHLETPEILALPKELHPVPASHGESSLVQIKLAEDDYGGAFSGGRSMRHSPSVEGLRFVNQEVSEALNGSLTIRTTLRGRLGFKCVHVLHYQTGDEAVTVHTEFENTSATVLTLEMLSSFSFGHLSPFDQEDSRERLRVHRFRSLWSSEGRHEASLLEDLHLERSWGSASVVNERFGQVGSMPVRGFFPFVAVEDVPEGVFWGAQLCCASSWQMEIYRRDDKLSVSGGLADREFGHWMKRIEPGERFVSPRAFLSTAATDLDVFCQRLSRMQERPLAGLPALENELPIVFNEWCSSWGVPTPEFIETTAKRLAETPVRIFVIDDGWAEKPKGAAQFNGDWNVELERFPNGLQPVAKSLREKGFVPGIWFEFEICTEGTDAFKLDEHKLRRNGRILKVGTRHFWDFTDPWTFQYLTEKVINRLRNDGFGYLKVDYNDTIGLGCDHSDSLGEGLRQHIEGVRRFFRKLREELPDLIIEMCSSGGHRLEPSMLELSSMASFSDAHESCDIPIIAANLHRLVLPRQSQIWAVLHSDDNDKRLLYSLAACFLGRVCLSGEIATLSGEQFEFIKDSLKFYEEVAHIIRDGESRILREMNKSYREPKGWQVVTRQARSGAQDILMVIHSFGESEGVIASVELPRGNWKIRRQMSNGVQCGTTGSHKLTFAVQETFGASIVHLTQESH